MPSDSASACPADDPFLGRRLSLVGELLVCSACLLGVYLHPVAELAV